MRYLLVYHLKHEEMCERGVKIQEGFGSLTNLQKLFIVQANNDVLKELRKLGQLRKLGIMLTNENGKNLCA